MHPARNTPQVYKLVRHAIFVNIFDNKMHMNLNYKWILEKGLF